VGPCSRVRRSRRRGGSARSQSGASALNLTSKGINVSLDAVLFRFGQIADELAYGDSPPFTTTVQAYATEAVNKTEGKARRPAIGDA
jgi:hypothetical protein